MESNITIEELLELVKSYNKGDCDIIRKAYDYAVFVHGNQVRKSGELYINHPLSVAYILATLYADTDTICAALLHDVIEDGDDITKDDIVNEFNETISLLVDGVTKMKLELFSSKSAQNYANTRKIIMSMKKDSRIIIIKLIDRLHNMMTLEYLPKNKQIQNALETLEIFVPIAKLLGAHQIQNILEELSFKYLNKSIYEFIEEQKKIYVNKKEPLLKETKEYLKEKLINLDLKSDISYRFKRNYAIYKGNTFGGKPINLLGLEVNDIKKSLNINSNNIHDLQSLKILVNNLDDCYSSLELIQNSFYIIPGKVKDCIMKPKTNGYQSLHTTILDSSSEKIQTQIRTFTMDKRDSLGIILNWQERDNQAFEYMNKEMSNRFPFFEKLVEIDEYIFDDKEFVEQIKKEILSDLIYIHTRDGRLIELPNGSTVMDFACHELHDINNKLIAMVNGRVVSLNSVLKTKDIVDLIPILNQKLEVNFDNVITLRAKQKLKQLNG